MRFHRSTREAFPCERFPAVFGPYRRRRLERATSAVLGGAVALLGLLALFAWIGALIGAGF